MTQPHAAIRLRAALYGRLSWDRSGKSRSVPQQLSPGEKACNEHGWEDVGHYADGQTGASRLSRKERSDWPRLVEDIRAGRVDVVVVWEWSRADRNLTRGSAFLDLCRERGILIHVILDRRTYDVKNVSADWKVLAHGLVDNAMEVEQISDRAKRDRRGRVEDGIVDGKMAYGYERVYDPLTREFIEQRIHAEQGPIVREIVQRIGAGEAVTTVARSLTERGIPTAKGNPIWDRSTVRGIAVNPAYISRRRVDDKLWPVDWPPIVTEAEHYLAVRHLADPARKTTRPGKALHLLSYIAECAECGGLLASNKRRANRDGVALRMYVCTKDQCAAVTADLLDEPVVAAICLHLADPDVYDQLTRQDDSEAGAIRSELGRLQTELEEWQNAAGTGVSIATIAAAERNLAPRIEDAWRRLRSLNPVGGALRALIGDEQQSYDALRVRWDGLEMAQRREVVREVVTVRLAALGRARSGEVGRITITPKR